MIASENSDVTVALGNTVRASTTASLRLAKVVAGEVDQLVSAAGEDRPPGEETDALHLAERHVRRHGELLLSIAR